MYTFELIEPVLANMKQGKAAELTVEYLTNSHSVFCLILAEIFNVIMSAAYVPYGFGLSYTVPLPKDDTTYKRNTVDSYRAISISPILSKIFEQCILLRYSKFLVWILYVICQNAYFAFHKIVQQRVSNMGGDIVTVLF